MNIKSYLKSALLVSALTASQMVNASDTRAYFGFSAGSSDDEVLNETETGIKLNVGAKLSENFGIEGAFVHLGIIDYGFTEISQYGISGNLIGYVPLGDRVSVFGRFGLFSWTFEVDSGGFVSEDTGVDVTYGVGLEVNLSERVSVLAEYDSYEVSDGDVSLVSLGFRYYVQ